MRLIFLCTFNHSFFQFLAVSIREFPDEVVSKIVVLVLSMQISEVLSPGNVKTIGQHWNSDKSRKIFDVSGRADRVSF